MKRDARIGLAVILILGLSITLLVARAIHNRAGGLQDPNEIARGWENPDGSAGSAPALPPSPEALAQEESLQQWINGHGGQRLQALQIQQPNRGFEHIPEVADPYGEMARSNGTEERLNTLPDPNAGGPQLTAMQFPENSTPPAPSVTNLQSIVNRTSFNPTPAESNTAAPPTNTHSSSTPKNGWQYTIEEGDNPWKIAVKLFGNGTLYKQIMEANSELDARKLGKGHKLFIPEIPNATLKVSLPRLGSAPSLPSMPTPVVAPTPAPNEAPAAETRVAEASALKDYTVQEGDTLGKIAKQFYGFSGPKSTQKIIEANPGLSPNRMAVGMNLKIPQ
jgi:LysM repeat protein